MNLLSRVSHFPETWFYLRYYCCHYLNKKQAIANFDSLIIQELNLSLEYVPEFASAATFTVCSSHVFRNCIVWRSVYCIFIEGSRCEIYVFAVAVSITLGSARDSRGVASMREAVSRVSAQREKTLRKPNIVYRLRLGSRDKVPVWRVVGILYDVKKLR